jgi:hypothetical protein
MRAWVPSAVYLMLFVFLSAGVSMAQDCKELICKTWKVRKILVNGERSSRKILNDHIIFTSDLIYESYNNNDEDDKYSIRGKWKLDKSGSFIIQNPGSHREVKLKILKVDEENLVYEMNMRNSLWVIHLKAD